MKTEAQLARTELELNAVDGALVSTHYYIRPRDFKSGVDNWHSYCRMLEGKLLDEMNCREYTEG